MGSTIGACDKAKACCRHPTNTIADAHNSAPRLVRADFTVIDFAIGSPGHIEFASVVIDDDPLRSASGYAALIVYWSRLAPCGAIKRVGIKQLKGLALRNPEGVINA